MEKAHCGICLAEFENGETLKVLNCSIVQDNADDPSQVQHQFHQDCIAAWFRKKQECPLCRHNFEPEVRAIADERRRKNGEEEYKSDEENAEGPQLRFSLNPFER